MKTKSDFRDVGAIGEYVNSQLAVWRESCPQLVAVGATLLPFADVISAASGGSYGKDGPQYIRIDIRNPDHRLPGDSTCAHVTADRVHVSDFRFGADGEITHHESLDMELPCLWEYLRQLPRSPAAYGRKL